MSDAPILGGLHRAENLETADDFAKKHTPFIACERDGSVCTVTVEVGHYVAHPNMADHFIEYIEVHANDVPIARFDFSAVAVSPRITCVLNLDPDTKLTAYESCNLHGMWAADLMV